MVRTCTRLYHLHSTNVCPLRQIEATGVTLWFRTRSKREVRTPFASGRPGHMPVNGPHHLPKLPVATECATMCLTSVIRLRHVLIEDSFGDRSALFYPLPGPVACFDTRTQDSSVSNLPHYRVPWARSSAERHNNIHSHRTGRSTPRKPTRQPTTKHGSS